MDGYSTDISMSESMTFDSCSLSEDSSSPKSSNTLPTKLNVKDTQWDEIDDLLQVKIYSFFITKIINLILRLKEKLTILKNSIKQCLRQFHPNQMKEHCKIL